MRWSWGGVLRVQRQRVARCLLEVSRDPGGRFGGGSPSGRAVHLLLNPACYQLHASDRYLKEVSP